MSTCFYVGRNSGWLQHTIVHSFHFLYQKEIHSVQNWDTHASHYICRLPIIRIDPWAFYLCMFHLPRCVCMWDLPSEDHFFPLVELIFKFWLESYVNRQVTDDVILCLSTRWTRWSKWPSWHQAGRHALVSTFFLCKTRNPSLINGKAAKPNSTTCSNKQQQTNQTTCWIILSNHFAFLDFLCVFQLSL